ncbi:MAG: anthranilate phosphoribosyltransferase [Micromonosporaceae bacterium]
MADRTWSHLISELLRGESLSETDTAWAMGEIMAGEASPSQIAGFVVALRAKGETPSEVAGFAEVMLANAVRVRVDQPAVDVVGTGGDRAHTVNISTMAAIVTAGAGVPVIKHGNRAASSSCGTADVLEHLGIPLDLSPEGVTRCVTEAGIGFCFAAKHHPGMRHAGATRRELGVPTVFNFLGPLTNPAQPTAGAVGVAEAKMAPVMAEVFARRGHSVLLMRGEDGLDEFTTTAATRLWVVTAGTVRETLVDAADFGLSRAEPGDLRGGDAGFNAEVVHRLLDGEPGPVRDAVLINAAAALAAFDGLGGDLAGSLDRGLGRAREAIDSGAAKAVLDRWISVAEAAKLG